MQEDNNKGLGNRTLVFMLVVAIFFDILQWLLVFIFMGWLVGIFAGLTFYVWFKMRGQSFMKPKRFLTFGGTFIIEAIPVISSLPAWTAAITILALDSKIKKIIPKPLQGVSKGKVLPFKRGVRRQSTDEGQKAA